MAEQPETAERPVSRTKEDVVREAKRIEESLLYTSKGNFAAAHFWKNFHLWIGVPIVILSGVGSATAFAHFDPTHLIARLISIVVVVLSALMTFFNPNEKANVHTNAGNSYDALQNKVRIFWSIDCWRDESDQVLTDTLKNFSEKKDKLNQSCPQVPRWAYNRAKKGIEAGEAQFAVDKSDV